MLPALSGLEFKELQAKQPVPIPKDIMELLNYSTGLSGLLESIDFTGKLDFEMLDLFPYALPIAHDGFGNFWVIDFTSQATDIAHGLF